MPLNVNAAIEFCVLALLILEDEDTNKNISEKPENTNSESSSWKNNAGLQGWGPREAPGRGRGFPVVFDTIREIAAN